MAILSIISIFYLYIHFEHYHVKKGNENGDKKDVPTKFLGSQYQVKTCYWCILFSKFLHPM